MTDPELDPAASDRLNRLGWHRHSGGFDLTTAEGTLGRVRRVDRGEVDVATADGDLRAMSDSQRAQSDLAPATGDWVLVVDDADVGLRLDRILERRTAIVRRDPAEKEVEQVLVANVDLVGVVAGIDRPPNIARVERFLVLAQDSGAEAIVVLTKTDLRLTDEWQAFAEQLGDVRVLRTSAANGDGVDVLHDSLAGDRTLVLLGESGSGKSTLVNALVGYELLDTGAVRTGDSKGRHTTTARELVEVPGGGILIDTPGVRGVGLWDAEHAVAQVFADITELGTNCRFNDCSHEVEPDCAVQAAVAEGGLDGRRVARFLRLRAELDQQADRLEQQRRRPEGRKRRGGGKRRRGGR